MCGIVYAQSFDGKPVNNFILNQFDAQRSRGVEGFGLFDGMKNNIVKEANEDSILKWLVKYDSDLILFHHRFPTSTINVKRAAHPFSTKDYFGDTQYILVHNGVISNKREMRKKHEELGIKYWSDLADGTFNDSESLLWELALTIEGKQEQMQVYGDMAFVCIKTVNGALERMYFGSNGRPLNMFRDKERLQLSSEGMGEAIDWQKLYNFHYKSKRLTSKDFVIPKFYYQAFPSSYTPASTYQLPASTGTPRVPYYDSYTQTDFYDRWGQNWDRDRYVEEEDLIDMDEDGNILFEYDYIDPDTLTQKELQDATALAFKYLYRGRGNFETAYYLMQNDYDKCSSYQERVNIECSMSVLLSDPEFDDENSVSSLYKEYMQPEVEGV
jgi:predicted glutamine amidotransferase